MELIVEVGMKLNQSLIYYHDMLIKHGLKLDASFITRDIYYTKSNLDGMTEGQMKGACVRLRYCNRINQEFKDFQKIIDKKNELISLGYKKVFDTIKIDFQYSDEFMKSKIQIQDIKDIGLVVYYDNPNYYKFSLNEQRKKLIDELNSYGFKFKYSDLGLDKLRTLYYKKEMFSENQNI